MRSTETDVNAIGLSLTSSVPRSRLEPRRISESQEREMAAQKRVGGNRLTSRTAIGAGRASLCDAFWCRSEEELPEGVLLHRTAGFGGIDGCKLFKRPSLAGASSRVALR